MKDYGYTVAVWDLKTGEVRWGFMRGKNMRDVRSDFKNSFAYPTHRIIGIKRNANETLRQGDELTPNGLPKQC